MSRLSGLLVIAALALVALGGYDIVRGDPPPGSAAPAAAQSPQRLAPIDLTTTHTRLGDVVTSGGATLYRYDRDSAKPARSRCTGACAGTWPPVLAGGGPPTLSGIEPAEVGTVFRPDGGRQLTLGGWPLYRYTGDTVPGEATGQGVKGSWHLVAPDVAPTGAHSRTTVPGRTAGEVIR